MFRARLLSIFKTCRTPASIFLLWHSLTQHCQYDSQKHGNITRLKCCTCYDKSSSEHLSRILRLSNQTTFTNMMTRQRYNFAAMVLIANGGKRLQTVGKEKSNLKRTHLHPHTPKIKKNPSIRIREKMLKVYYVSIPISVYVLYRLRKQKQLFWQIAVAYMYGNACVAHFAPSTQMKCAWTSIMQNPIMLARCKVAMQARAFLLQSLQARQWLWAVGQLMQSLHKSYRPVKASFSHSRPFLWSFNLPAGSPSHKNIRERF